ncbi:MAG: hypothetical protein ACE5EX_03735, partial [Phycisphaerae bacterium]
LYHDPLNPKQCVCPGRFPGISPLQFGEGQDEGCNGIFDAGPGFQEAITAPGDCWLIRVGGFASDVGAAGQTGRGLLSISCESVACPISAPPVEDTFPSAAGSPVRSENNRYLSFSAGDTGRVQAIRVRFGGDPTNPSLPPAFSSWQGLELWVQAPEKLGSTPSAKIGDPIPPGGDFINVAKLGCTPFFTNWTQMVVPSVRGGAAANYDIQVIDADCAVEERFFSDPLSLTDSVWADVTGAFFGGRPTQADGVIDTKDIIAGVDGFSRPATSAPKQKVDLLRNGANPGLVDGGIDFVGEVTRIVDAAGGAGYPAAFVVSPPVCP